MAARGLLLALGRAAATVSTPLSILLDLGLLWLVRGCFGGLGGPEEVAAVKECEDEEERWCFDLATSFTTQCDQCPTNENTQGQWF